MGFIGRALRILIVGFTTLIGSLCACSIVIYALYGHVFAKTVRAAVSYAAAFYGTGYLVWRFCGGKRQRDRDRGIA